MNLVNGEKLFMKKIFVLGLICFSCAFVFSQEMNFSGEVSTLWGVTAPGTKNAGDLSVGKTDFTGAVEVYQGDGTCFVEGSVGYDAISSEVDFDLAEAYVDYSSSFWGFRMGAQKVAWGKADGVDITNSVFPSDSSSLFNDDSSIAINALRLSFSGSAFTVDGYWIPFYKGSKLPLDEGNALRYAIIPESVDINLMGFDFSLPVNVGALENPEIKIKNGEYGLKISAYLPFCDFSLYGFYGWDKTPLMKYDVKTEMNDELGFMVPASITINGEYKRMAMAGFDAAFPIGETVLRVENAYFPQRAVQASGEAIMSGEEIFVKQNQIMGLVGIDWMPSDWTVTAQYYYDVLLNKSDKIEREDAFTHGATLSVSKSLLQETLELSLSGMMGFNAFDSVINFQTKYSITDQLKISGGCYVFLPGPEKDGTYGALKDLSTVFIKCQYSF